MALQHLRSNTASKRPTAGAMSDGQIAVNTNATSPGLFFKDAGGAIIKVGPVHVGTTAPNSSPAGSTGNSLGEQWLDTSGGSYVLKIWDGSAWRSEVGEFVDAAGDTMTGALILPNGTAAAPALGVGSTDNGVYSPGADQVAISTSGTGRLFVDAGGNVGVGVNPPSALAHISSSYATPSTGGINANTRLIVSNNNLASSEANISLLYRSNAKGRLNFGSQIVEDVAYVEGGVNYLAFGTGSGTASAAERLRITSTGQIQSGGLGSAASPALSFSSDTNTGIYSPGADQLALSTSGTGRLFVDSAGNVGIGTSSPDGLLTVRPASGNAQVFIRTNDTTSRSQLIFGDSADANTGGIQYNHTTDNLEFHVGNLGEKMTLDASGRLGIGTSAVATVLGGKTLEIEDSSGSELILSNSTQGLAGNEFIGGVAFQNNDTSGSPPHYAGIWAKTNDAFGYSNLYLAAGRDSYETGTPHLTIDYLGNVGIGTTSPSALLHVDGSAIIGDSTFGTASQVTIYGNTGGVKKDSLLVLNASATQTGRGAGISIGDNSTAIGSLYVNRGATAGTGSTYLESESSIVFLPNNSTAATLDSSGRLLVGTSSSSTGTEAANCKLTVAGNTVSGLSGAGLLNLQKGTAATSTSYVGRVVYSDNTHDFAYIDSVADGSTTAGRLVFSTTADGASSPTERMRIDSVGRTVIYQNTSTTSAGVLFVKSDVGGINNTNMLVYANGNIQNTNNSYGAISDIKLKENIVDANSQWDDLKALQVRNYNFKEGQTHTQIGLIAQEVELVSPGLVSESPDRDEDGNDLGTVTKSVNYSVLYMKAVKALQEAMERIETLEQRLNDAGIN